MVCNVHIEGAVKGEQVKMDIAKPKKEIQETIKQRWRKEGEASVDLNKA